MALEQMAGKAANEIDERFGSANFVKRSARKVFPDHWSFMLGEICLLYTSPSPRDRTRSRMPSSA